MIYLFLNILSLIVIQLLSVYSFVVMVIVIIYLLNQTYIDKRFSHISGLHARIHPEFIEDM